MQPRQREVIQVFQGYKLTSSPEFRQTDLKSKCPCTETGYLVWSETLWNSWRCQSRPAQQLDCKEVQLPWAPLIQEGAWGRDQDLCRVPRMCWVEYVACLSITERSVVVSTDEGMRLSKTEQWHLASHDGHGIPTQGLAASGPETASSFQLTTVPLLAFWMNF